MNNLSLPMFTFRFNFIFHISAYVSLKIVLSQVKVLQNKVKVVEGGTSRLSQRRWVGCDFGGGAHSLSSAAKRCYS